MSVHLRCQITHVACQKQHNQIWLGFLFHLLPMWAKPKGIMERCHAEMCSLACLPGVSSLNWCLCLAAAYIPKTTVTHSEISPRQRFQLPGLGRKITQGLVTTLIALWFLTESEAKSQECHHLLARAPRLWSIIAIVLSLGNLFTPAVKIWPFFFCQKYLFGDFQSRVEDYKGFFS